MSVYLACKVVLICSSLIFWELSRFGYAIYRLSTRATGGLPKNALSKKCRALSKKRDKLKRLSVYDKWTLPMNS